MALQARWPVSNWSEVCIREVSRLDSPYEESGRLPRQQQDRSPPTAVPHARFIFCGVNIRSRVFIRASGLLAA